MFVSKKWVASQNKKLAIFRVYFLSLHSIVYAIRLSSPVDISSFILYVYSQLVLNTRSVVWLGAHAQPENAFVSRVRVVHDVSKFVRRHENYSNGRVNILITNIAASRVCLSHQHLKTRATFSVTASFKSSINIQQHCKASFPLKAYIFLAIWINVCS